MRRNNPEQGEKKKWWKKIPETVRWVGGGMLAGEIVSTALRTPVFFMMANCECPELGLVEAYGFGAGVGALLGTIGLINEKRKRRKNT